MKDKTCPVCKGNGCMAIDIDDVPRCIDKIDILDYNTNIALIICPKCNGKTRGQGGRRGG